MEIQETKTGDPKMKKQRKKEIKIKIKMKNLRKMRKNRLHQNKVNQQ